MITCWAYEQKIDFYVSTLLKGTGAVRNILKNHIDGGYSKMKMTMRYYGKDYDSVTLEQLRQIRYVEGLISTLCYFIR